MKLCLIGSSRFKDQYAEANKRLTLQGHIVYTIATVSTAAGEELPEEQKMILDLVHLKKIEESECVVLISDASGYYGFSTRREMLWAGLVGKAIAIYVPNERADLYSWSPMYGARKITDIPTVETVAQVWAQVMNPNPQDETFGNEAGNGQTLGRPISPGGSA